MKLVMIIGLVLAIHLLFSHLKQLCLRNTGRGVEYKILAGLYSSTVREWSALWGGVRRDSPVLTAFARAEVVVLFCLIFSVPILILVTIVAQVLVWMGLISPSA